MPYAIFGSIDIGASGFAHVDNVIPVIKTITRLLLSRLQGNKPHRNSPEPSEPCLRNLHSPEPSGTFRDLPEATFRNLPEPTSGTYFRNQPPEPTHTPKPSEIFRNLPELASRTFIISHRNSPEPSGICLRNLHQHTPDLSEAFRNLSPEPPPATRTGTHRSLSGLKTPLAHAVGEKNQVAKHQVHVELQEKIKQRSIKYHVELQEKIK